MKQYPWILATIVIASTTLPIQSFASTPKTTTQTNLQEDSRVLLAKVNTQPIYKDQLEPQIKIEIRKYQKLISKKELSPSIEANIQNKILQQYINAELIHQASQKYPVENIEEKVKLYIQKAKEKNQPIQNETTIKRQIHIDEYLKANDLISPKPSDKEVRAFYEKGKEQFVSTEDKVHAQHIFIEKPNKEKINKVNQLLKSGQPFEKIAKEYSEDENSKEKGGNLGFIAKGYMPKEFEDIAFNIQKGTLSEIIETEEGYHILKILEVSPTGTTIPYERIKDFLAQGLASKIKEEKIAAHLKNLKNNADIKIF